MVVGHCIPGYVYALPGKYGEVKHWFDGSWKVINERNIMTTERILRPDRIMVSGENAIVVDYKTGEQKSNKYNSQVKRYAKTLKETGYQKVEG